MYEVELKFHVADVTAVERRLAACAARFEPAVEQVDRYFAHPCRDFAVTDEALRLRRVGDDVAITWKGPRLGTGAKSSAAGCGGSRPRKPSAFPAVDRVEKGHGWLFPQSAKTREEIELALAAIRTADGTGPGAMTIDHWTRLLEALGFRRVREVAKRRRPARLTWEGVEVEIALDAVAGLGDFIELELLTEPAGIPQATARIESLAAALGCTAPERRSYLEMLCDAERRTP